MITTGIIVAAVAAALSILNILFIAGSAASDREAGFIIGFAFHILCALGWIVGLTLIALGLAERFL